MGDNKRMLCPFFASRSRKGKQRATITCENIENNLGFDLKNQLLFTSYEEELNYSEIFCGDMFETCPYYKGIYKYQGGKKHEKENVTKNAPGAGGEAGA